MIRTLLAATLAISPLLAQATVAHANFDTLVYDDGQSMGGPNLWLGLKTTLPTAFVATRIEVFTGERAGTNTIALWSHDAVNNRPLAPLGSGAWQMGITNSWQGAPLATPVPLAAGQTVWVVWSCQNGSQSSIEGSGGGAQYRGSFDGGTTWTGPFSGVQWKFRIWSGPAGHYQSFGAGCNGGAGVPRLSWFGLPMAGSSFDVQLDRAMASNVALLVIGDSNTTYNGLPLPFNLAPLGAPACSLLTSVTATFATPTDATGAAVLTLAIPANPALAGFLFWNQWACLDLAANTFGFTFSNGGAATVGA
jgi:hypothetical protein